MVDIEQFKAIALIVVVILFAVGVVLPMTDRLSDQAENFSNDSNENVTKNVEETAKQWWEDLARTAPFLFVGVVFFLFWIGAGDLL